MDDGDHDGKGKVMATRFPFFSIRSARIFRARVLGCRMGISGMECKHHVYRSVS